MLNTYPPVVEPRFMTRPSYRDNWRDRLAVAIANMVLRLIATKRYRELATDMYVRGYIAAHDQAIAEMMQECDDDG